MSRRTGQIERLVSRFPPFFLLGFGLVLSFFCMLLLRQNIRDMARYRFDRRVRHIRDALYDRMQDYIDTVEQARGLFYVAPHVSSQVFKSYVENIHLSRQLWGSRGLGYAKRVRTAQGDRFLVEMLERGNEPVRGVRGWDIFSEEVRRAAGERARDTGLTTASGPVKLRPDQKSGFFIYVPVYRGTVIPDTLKERRARLQGFIYSPFRAQDLLESVFHSDRDLGFDLQAFAELRLVDGADAQASALLYEYRHPKHFFQRSSWWMGGPDFESRSQIWVAGRPWVVTLRSLPLVDAGLPGFLPLGILAMGALISLLFFRVAWVTRKKIKAEERARLRIEESEHQNAFIAAAGKRLTQSFDLEDTLSTAVDLAINEFGGLAALYLVDEQGQIRRHKALFDDPQMRPMARLFDGQSLVDPEIPFGAPAVIRSGRSELAAKIPDHALQQSFTDVALRTQMEQMGLSSYFCVPLTARGRILGALLGVSRQKSFRPAELSLAEELARRCGMALDNSRLVSALKASEENLRLITETIPQIVWTALPNGTIDSFNHRWKEYTGLTPDQGWKPALHPLDYFRTLRLWARSTQTGIPFECEYRLRESSSGTHRWHLGRALPVYGTNGEIVRWFGTCTDIHDQKRNEESLRRVQGELESQTVILDTLNRVGRQLSAELDLHRLVQSVTEATTHLCRARYGAFFYQSLNDRGEKVMLSATAGIPEDFVKSTPPPGRSELFERTFIEKAILRLEDVTKDPRFGSRSPFGGLPPDHFPVRSYLAVPVKSRSGDVLGALFFGHPEPGVFSEREELVIEGLAAQAAVAMDNAQLFQKAQNAIRARDEFLSIASHELRTPITPLKLQLQMTRRNLRTRPKAPTPEEMTQALDISLQQVDRLAGLVDNLLDVSRLEAGKLVLQQERFDLGQVARNLLERFAHQFREAHCEVQIETPAPVVGHWDRLRIEQVVINLFSNALKYGAGHPISVRVTTENALARLEVKDQGIGIPPDKQERVFERFERAVSHSQISGLGLGLYIVRQIVQAHAGKVFLKSAVGQGSTFTIELPLSVEKDRGNDNDRRAPATNEPSSWNRLS